MKEPTELLTVVADNLGHEWVKETDAVWSCHHSDKNETVEFNWTWDKIYGRVGDDLRLVMRGSSTHRLGIIIG